MENSTFFLKSLSSLPGFSCHREKKGCRACSQGSWDLVPSTPNPTTSPQSLEWGLEGHLSHKSHLYCY